MLVSVVIRTLNESLYLAELLQNIKSQKKDIFDVEVVVIDSGSTDGTLKIAHDFGSRITFIDKKDFTFGRSLNHGSDYANGEILIYISGHCIPIKDDWIKKLIQPIIEDKADYTYGSQKGRATTKYSETKIFEKYFPDISDIPQKGFFCNNANSAIKRDVWEKYYFNENITGLEDMELAKRLYDDGGKIGYVSDAAVFHIHDETWHQTRRRYEREALALQLIMPEVQISFLDMIRYIWISIISDSKDALKEKIFLREFFGIIKFRIAQYSVAYRGNHEHRSISKRRKENYFYPSKKIND